MPDHPSCPTPVIVDPVPPTRPTFPTYYPRVCSLSSDADVVRAFSGEIKEINYQDLVRSLTTYKSLKLPGATACLDGIILANSCAREKAYGLSFAMSCIELDQDPGDYITACRTTLESASESEEVNAFSLALGKVVEKTHCSLNKLTELVNAPAGPQQPDCLGAGECLGGNVSPIPLAVRNYRFPGNRGIQWNHQIKLVHEYNPKRWQATSTSAVESLYNFPAADCTEQDLQNMYVTDRVNKKLALNSVGFYTHNEFPKTKAGWDDWNARKKQVYENIKSYEIREFGPDIFIEVTPRDASGSVLPFNVSSIDKLENRSFEAETCKIQVLKVDSFPTEGSLTAINTEAARLEQDLVNKGDIYATAKRYDNFVNAVEIPRMMTMSQSVESAFNSLVAAAMSADCESLPPPPFLPISGMVPLEPDTMETNCEDNGLAPSSFGLPISDWQQLNLYELGVVFLDKNKKAFMLNLTRENARWYFEARERQPRIKGALEKILVEIAQIQTGIYFKQHPEEVEGLELPDVQAAIVGLTKAIAAAKTFVDAFDAYKQLLEGRLDEIRRKIEQREKELPKKP